MPLIHFFEEQIRFKLSKPRKTTAWILEVISLEKSTTKGLNFIFCNDSYLRKINIEYLRHHNLTDIITFDYSEESGIQGDVYISIQRVKENALKFNTEFDDELHRVIVHGVLHLLGYSDKTTRAKATMRKKEDAYLSLRAVPRETRK